mmetsp:Transcript_125429/g.313361  ORF Transcript_125429/g.313361 Transcript_125429/m.313361 type:complete len:203 (+) Transcript_125429:40-648(+)
MSRSSQVGTTKIHRWAQGENRFLCRHRRHVMIGWGAICRPISTLRALLCTELPSLNSILSPWLEATPRGSAYEGCQAMSVDLVGERRPSSGSLFSASPASPRTGCRGSTGAGDLETSLSNMSVSSTSSPRSRLPWSLSTKSSNVGTKVASIKACRKLPPSKPPTKLDTTSVQPERSSPSAATVKPCNMSPGNIRPEASADPP